MTLYEAAQWRAVGTELQTDGDGTIRLCLPAARESELATRPYRIHWSMGHWRAFFAVSGWMKYALRLTVTDVKTYERILASCRRRRKNPK